mmetsp:Transcript_8084/g.16782  ORF Transcript_8084/g.16782 Transcript_8084/m.16782 type:complete len:432 (-) Transcript_8084:367-1662(-)
MRLPPLLRRFRARHPPPPSISSPLSQSSFSHRSISVPEYEGLRITRIMTYQADLGLHEGRYTWAGGKYVDVFDTTVVAVETNDPDITGYGENCPLGSNYLPMFAGGTRAGIEEMARHLVGADPTRLLDVNRRMDWLLSGHPNAKSAIDMACWDILGKKAQLPVCKFLGGRFGKDFKLYRAISQASPEAMAENVRQYCEEGYTKFQLKVGNKPHDDIRRIRAVRTVLDAQTARAGENYPLLCNANTGLLMHEAMQVVNGVADLDVYIEMPCETYEECRSVRDHTNLPFVLDECIQDVGMMVRILADRAADVVNLKIGRLGGLTKARVVRDLCVSAGVPMNVEDTWGGDVTQAAIAALAHSTPPEMLFCATDFNSYGPDTIADTTAVRRDGGRMAAPIDPGLGVFPRWDVLGEPVYDTSNDQRPVSECPNKPF